MRISTLILVLLLGLGTVQAQSDRGTRPLLPHEIKLLPHSSSGLEPWGDAAMVVPQSGQPTLTAPAVVQSGGILAASGPVQPAASGRRELYPYVYQSDLRFVPNVGQILDLNGNQRPEIKYKVQQGSLAVYFTQRGLHYAFARPKAGPPMLPITAESIQAQEAEQLERLRAYWANRDKPAPASSQPLETPQVRLPEMEYYRLDLTWPGSNPNPELLTDSKADFYLNFYLPHTVGERTQVPTYQRLVYRNLYPNIDLVFYGKGEQLKYDFVVHPGGDPSQIRLKYEGASSIKLLEDGSLRVETPFGDLTESVPFSFQEMPAVQTAAERARLAGSSNVPTRYRIHGNEIQFEIPRFDSQRILVIDPTLIWSTYYGGDATDFFHGIESHNGSGDVYTVGISNSANFPTQTAFQPAFGGGTFLDAVVVKFNAAGAVQWATYYGGAGTDVATDVAVYHATNEIYFTGFTTSANFPTLNPAQAAIGGSSDAFLVKMDQAGARLWATFYGGGADDAFIYPSNTGGAPNTYNLDIGGVAVDQRNGDAVIIGSTMSLNLPGVANGIQGNHASPMPPNAPINGFPVFSDIFVAKFAAAGTLTWGTYYGSPLMDFGVNVEVDANGEIYCLGGTLSFVDAGRVESSLPTLNGYRNLPLTTPNRADWDLAILRIGPNCELRWATLFGGTGNESPATIGVFAGGGTLPFNNMDIKVNARGNPVIGASTSSTIASLVNAADVPRVWGTDAAGWDALVFELSSGGGANSFLWGRYHGANGQLNFAKGLDVFTDNRIAFGGITLGTNLPMGADPPLQAAHAGDFDGFLAICSDNGLNLQYNTYIGGTGREYIFSVDVNRTGAIHACGRTSTNNFLEAYPVQPNRPKNAQTASDAFVVAFNEPLQAADPCRATADGNLVRVLALTLGADLVREYPNTIAALRQHFQSYVLTETNTSDPATLAALLANADVLLIPEVEDPAAVPLYAGLRATINGFANAGGTVIFVGTNGFNASGLDAIFLDPLLLPGTYQGSSTDLIDARVRSHQSCYALGLPGQMILPPTLSVYTFTSAATEQIIEAGGFSMMAVRTLGTGRIIYIGLDYDVYNSASGKILANAVSCTAGGANSVPIQLSAKVTSASCQNGNDGAIELTVSHAPVGGLTFNWVPGNVTTRNLSNLPPGDYTVTVTGGNPNNPCRETLTVTVPPCTLATDAPERCTALNLNLTATNSPQCQTGAQPVEIRANDENSMNGCGRYDLESIPFAPVDINPNNPTLVGHLFPNGPFSDGNLAFSDFDGPYSLGFDLTYYCEKYKFYWVSRHGYIAFSEEANVSLAELTFERNGPNEIRFNNSIPDVRRPNGIVALNFASLSNALGGIIVSAIDGTAPNRRLIVTYSNVWFQFQNQLPNNTGQRFSGQLIINENGVIEFHIGSSPAVPNVNVNVLGSGTYALTYEKTMGIESPDGTQAVVVDPAGPPVARNKDATWAATNEGWRFTPRVLNPRYEWYNVTANPNTPIAGETNPVLTQNPTDTTRYRLRVYHERSCYSETEIEVIVDEPSLGGTVQSNRTACPNINTGTLTLTGRRGNVIRWEASTDNFNTNIVPITNTTASYTFNNLTQNTSFRAVVQNGTCPPEFATPATVTLQRPSVNILQARNISCFGRFDGLIEAEGTGGEAPYTYRWTLNGNPFVPVTGLIQNLGIGTYCVTATDANNCASAQLCTTLNQPPRLDVNLFRRINVSCSGGSDGAIEIQVSGGTPDYTYAWTGPNGYTSTNQNISGLGVGFYSLTVTDANNCTAELNNIQILEPTGLQVSTTNIRPVTCFGFSDGEIQLDVSGGTPFTNQIPPYNFRWGDTGQNIEDRTGLAAGTYALTITDAAGCRLERTFAVPTPAALSATLVQLRNPRCFGESNGEIQLFIEGGTQRYTFRWNDPGASTTEDLVGLSAGTYSITVTDRNGCVLTRSYTLTDPPPVQVSITQVVPPSCNGGSNGSLTAEATGGVGNYLYRWTGNRTGATIVDLAAGLYCVSVEDANNCLAQACTTLSQPVPIEIGLDVRRDISCAGRTDGEILINVSGGVLAGDPAPAFSYSWSGPGAYTSSLEDITGLGAGTYCVTATIAASGCSASRCFVITEPAPLEITENTVAAVRCNGAGNGAIDVSISGGTQPYTISWTGPNGFSASTEDLVGIGGGTYTLRVNDLRGCEATRVFDVAEPAALAIELLTQRNVTCGGGSDGFLGIDERGGVPAYSYVWSRAGETLEELRDLSAGTYCVTLTDGNNCRVSRCFEITAPAALQVSGVVRNAGCKGGSSGGVDLTVRGGTEPYRFIWSQGVVGGPEVVRTQNLTDVPAGVYAVLVSDANDCPASATFTIGEPSAIVVLNEVVQPVRCAGTNTGSIQVAAGGGTGSLVYSWRRNGVPFGTAQPAIGGLTAGTYELTIRDANGCELVRSYELVDPPLLTLSIVDRGDVRCRGGSDGFLEVVAAGGTEPYVYRWLHNGWPQARIVGLRAGGYTVQVTDVRGCRATVSGVVNQPQALSLTVNQIVNVNCFDGSTGRIELTVSGGTLPYAYSWSGPNGFASVSAPPLADLRAGRYAVTVTDGNGCVVSASNLNVGQPSAALVAGVINFTNPRCAGGRDGTILVQATGGTLPYTYVWDGAVSGNVPLATGLGAGSYCVQIRDGRGCEQQVCQTLVEPDPLRIEFNRERGVSCAGGSDGAIYPDVFGGTEPYQYRWTGTNPTYNSFETFLENVGPNRYCLQIRDARGCEVVECRELVSPEPLVIEVVRRVQPLCSGESSGRIEVSVRGGVEPYAPVWIGPNGFSSNELTLIDIPAGLYSLTVLDNNGCRASRTVSLFEPLPLTAVATVIPVRCPGESTGSIIWNVRGGSGPYVYRWSDNGSRTGSAASGLVAGCYQVTVEDGNGCEALFEACVSEPEAFEFDAEVLATACFGESNGGISMRVSGGTQPYSFLWSNGRTTESLFDVPAGDYVLRVRDSRGCEALSATYRVEEPAALEFVEQEVTDVRCAGGSDGSLRVRIAGGVEPYRYFWRVPGSGEVERADLENLTDLVAGEYCLRAVDANNCEARLCLRVGEPDSLRIRLDQITGVVCTSGSDGSIEVTVSGGVEPYVYVWSDAGATATEDLSGVREGVYCLEVRDGNGCQTRSCFEVPLEAQAAEIEGLPARICAGASAVSLTGLPGGGTFTGPGISGSEFSPEGLEPGIYSIVYEVTDAGGCRYEARREVEVLSGPLAASLVYGGLPAGPPFCANVTTAYTLTYAPLQAGVVASASGPGISQTGGGFVFRPAVSGAGTFEHVLVLRNTSTGCARVIRSEVEVGNPVNVVLTPSNASACPGEEVSVRLTGASRYEWSPSAGVVENALGEYTVSAGSTTTYTVTGFNGGCRQSRLFRLTVLPVVPVAVVPGPSVEVCTGFSQVLRAVSSGNYTYTWSPADDLSATEGAEVVVRPRASRTYTVTGLPSGGGCVATAEVEVVALPAGVEVSADRTVLCAGTVATLTAVGVPAGDYTYTWSPAVGLSSAVGSEVTASPEVTTEYTVTRSGTGQCRSATIEIEVVRGDAEISGLLLSYCASAECVELAASPAGGVFSGLGVSGTQFCPRGLPAGPVEILYSGDAGGCPFEARAVVEVLQPQPVELVGFGGQYCAVGNPVRLVPAVAGSVVSGPGVVGGFFDPGLAGRGEHELMVVPPAGAGCFAETMMTVEVFDPRPAITNVVPVYCVSGEPVQLVGEPVGGSFRLTPSRAGALTVGGLFSPALAGVGTHLITYFGFEGPCSYSTTVPVQVIANVVASAQSVPTSEPLAADGLVTVAVAGGRAPYEYSIDGATWQAAPVFEGLVAGTYEVCVRDGVGCRTCVGVEVRAGAPVCNRPEGVRTERVSDTEAELAWEPVSGAVGYVVEYRDQRTSVVRTRVVSGPGVLLTGLVAGRVYVVTVRSDCGGGNESPLTEEFLFEVPVNCAAPAVVGVVPQSTGAVVSWPGVLGATSYVVSWRALPGGPVSSQAVSGTSLVLSGLQASTEYVVEVRTVCGSAGSGVTSSVFRTQPGAATCVAPSNVRVESIAATGATVRWVPVSGAIGYVVSWRRAVSTASWVSVTLNGGGLDQFRISNLISGSGYEVRVRTRCSASVLSPWSGSVGFGTLSARSEASVGESSVEVSVYPNPTRGRFAVSVSAVQAEAMPVAVFDLRGRLVWRGELAAGQSEVWIDLEGVASGLYLLRVRVGELDRVVKVVVE